MAKTKAQKQEMLQAYKSKLDKAMGVLVVSPTGLTPIEANVFKKKLFNKGNSFNVVKNTLFAKALKDAGMPELETLSGGTHAVVFVQEDIAGTAKELKEFIKTTGQKLEIKAGILDGQALTAEQVDQLAEMPTKQESIAMIAGLMTLAMGGVVNVLEDSVRSVATILDMAFSKEKAT
jgi:large subunit ribosomal protein L10